MNIRTHLPLLLIGLGLFVFGGLRLYGAIFAVDSSTSSALLKNLCSS